MRNKGSALLVTAAFIGPGTVTTASLAGGTFGFALVWGLVFSVVATYVLQEMASRLGLITGKGLAENIRQRLTGNAGLLACILIVGAIGVGNAAYQGGNLTGAALGLANLIGYKIQLWVWLIGSVATALLLLGRYWLIEKVLIGLVMLMSLVFLLTLFIAQPDWAALVAGVFSFSIPDGATLMLIALIGTTVVPYNLFLHASIVAQNRPPQDDLAQAIKHNRLDSALSIGLGGIVTLAILSCAATAFFANQIPIDGKNIASQLEPLLGSYANLFFAIGLFSAGLTSAITAPLAAAYAVSGALGWNNQLNDKKFRLVWFSVMVFGIVFASLGFKPLAAIMFAQAANGMLLPVIAIYLIWVMNSKKVLGDNRNHIVSNIAGGVVVVAVSVLGLYKLISVF